MKSTLLLFSLLAFVFVGHAQESRRERAVARPNHIMLDPISLIAGPVLNFSYERAINEDVGLGLHSLLGLGAMDEMIQFSPFGRLYVGGSHGAGFFMEAFVPITNMEETFQKYSDAHANYTEVTERRTSAGLGVGLGGKWLFKRNLMLEVGGGIARKFINTTDNTESITGKWMIGFGYAF
ncbi:hypothetical protein [Sphingobacterium corticibacterium]|uniref:DUF3575 domain-containing protein n=1 Tax=Sphingobacterium corticibacterium TaxID=2484746 RepID=A0A4Q6XG20_9SPHI|nr:hypothetical protein [Sphingobacterium corticibacterium]RZF58423.1 hypothetical protein EWE74_17595 [Sphingobacterium corticibacterium]